VAGGWWLVAGGWWLVAGGLLWGCFRLAGANVGHASALAVTTLKTGINSSFLQGTCRKMGSDQISEEEFTVQSGAWKRMAGLVALTMLAAGVGSGTTAWIDSSHSGGLQGTAQSASLINIQKAPRAQTTSYTPPGGLQTVQVNISDGIVKAVKKATPTVVGVLNMQDLPNAYGTGYALQEAAVGSGVIFSPDGYIVTNNHVVQGANQVDVVIDQKTRVIAKVIGTDPYTDLAVLKVPATDIQPDNVATFGDSADLQVGQPAIAIGNPAGLQFADTVTAGIISATQRTMPVQDEATGQTLGQENVLQTDAAINPGNSGGPLLNIEGQVVGINSSKIAASGFSGMGFAIPSDEVQRIVNQILTSGHALHAALGIEGMSLADLPQSYWPNVPVNYGIWVDKADNALSKKAGFEHDDVIVAVDGHKVTGLDTLEGVLNQYQPGQTVAVTIYRGQREMTLQDTLSNLPPLQLQNNAGGAVVG